MSRCFAAHFQGKALANVDFEAVKKAIREEEGGEKRKQLERVIEAITKLETVGTTDGTTVQNEQTALSTLINDRGRIACAATRGDTLQTPL